MNRWIMLVLFCILPIVVTSCSLVKHQSENTIQDSQSSKLEGVIKTNSLAGVSSEVILSTGLIGSLKDIPSEIYSVTIPDGGKGMDFNAGETFLWTISGIEKIKSSGEKIGINSTLHPLQTSITDSSYCSKWEDSTPPGASKKEILFLAVNRAISSDEDKKCGEYFDSGVTKDSNTVYYSGKKVIGADPNTFDFYRLIRGYGEGYVIFSDKSRIYHIIDTELVTTGVGITKTDLKWISNSYVTDDKALYHYTIGEGFTLVTEIGPLDIISIIGGEFIRVNNSLYQSGKNFLFPGDISTLDEVYSPDVVTPSLFVTQDEVYWLSQYDKKFYKLAINPENGIILYGASMDPDGGVMDNNSLYFLRYKVDIPESHIEKIRTSLQKDNFITLKLRVK